MITVTYSYINSLLLSLTFQYNDVYIIIYYTFCCHVYCQYRLWHNAVLFVDKNISEDNAASSFRVDVLSKYSYQLPRLCGVTTQKTKCGYSQLWKPKNFYMCYIHQHCFCVTGSFTDIHIETGSFINIHIETKAGSL
jgi:hypothetical protein